MKAITAMAATSRSGQALIQREHGALIRQMAGLQTRVSQQLQDMARQVVDLERALMATRAQLVVVRTALLWGLKREGLSWPGADRFRPMPPTPTPARRPMHEANAVICQTGCVGHAHPWLEADGQCRRTGHPCDLVGNSKTAHKADDWFDPRTPSGGRPDEPMVVDLNPAQAFIQRQRAGLL
jgi:hypothetical protein